MGTAPFGCTALDDQRRVLSDLYAQGRFDVAAATLDDPTVRQTYGAKNDLLWWLDRGGVALALHDQKTTIDLFEKAEDYMEVRRGPSAGDEISRWLLDDTAAPYYGEPYEDIYTNVLKLLAQLEQGHIQGGATVEARRAAGKADVLRDRYLKYKDAVYTRAGPGFSQAVRSGGLIEANDEGRFIESPLGTFLTAVTFMKAGDVQDQAVAGRRLLDSIRLQHGLIGPAREEDFAGLGERSPDTVNVLVVALSGRCPTKEVLRIGPIPIFDWPVYFELPVLRGGSAEAASARVVVAPAGAPGETGSSAASEYPGATESHPLAFVEDMRSVATENHKRELPFIYARALLRSSIKAGASFAATQAVRHNTRNREGRSNNAAVIGSVLGGLAFVALTERADLRCWTFLPGQAHVGLLRLPPGAHRVRVEYLSSSGGVLYSTPWRTITVPTRRSQSRGWSEGASESGGGGGGGRGDSELITVVEHYWR